MSGGLLATGCTDGAPRQAAPPTPRAGPVHVDPETPAPVETVVATHATVPPLSLRPRTVARLVSGELPEWRGRRVVAGPPRSPDQIGLVRLDQVGPTVNVARVGGRDPIRDDPRAVRLTIVGDLMLTRGVPDPVAALAPLRQRLARADLTVGNLESTLSTDGPAQQGGDSFGASPDLVPVLADAGFDAVSLANNHTGDYGSAALLATVEALAASSVRPFGAGADRRIAGRPAYLSAGGVTFALIGFNAIGETPRATRTTAGALSVRMPPRTGPLNRRDLEHVVNLVRRADARADAVVVLPHWGEQYTHRPEPVQREVARALVRAGADLVVGGHPHWVQGVDEVDGVPVLHSLGNFVFDMDFAPQTMEGVVLETTWWEGELKGLRLQPYRMDPGTFAPRLLRGTSAAGLLAGVWAHSTGPFTG